MAEVLPEKKTPAPVPVISVIVPMFNAENTIERCLDSIFASRLTEPFQVLVVDDGSTDGTLARISKYPVEVIRQPSNQGVASTRNAGAGHARSSLIFFCDADVRIYPETLPAIVAEFRRDSELQILNCSVTNVALTPGLVGTYLAYKGGYDHWRLRQEGRQRVEISYLQTLAVALKREVFDEWQFNVSYQDPGGEEFELGHRLSSHFKLWLYPDIMVDHDYRPWRERLRANFIRTVRWVPLFLKRRGKFESTTGVATSARALSTVVSTTAVVLALLAFVHPLAGLICLIALAAKLPLEYGFFRLLAREQGSVVAIGGFFFEVLYESFFGFGFAWGLLRHGAAKMMRLLSAPARLAKEFRFLINRTPPHLVWFCTAKCNQRCGHCFYWKRLNSGASELSLEEIRKVAASLGHIKYLTITGGEPSLRADLVECIAAFYQLNGLQQVGYHTNGMLPQTVLEQMIELTRRCPELVVICSVSIDHFEQEHDRLRCTPGAFVTALETLELLKPLKSLPNFDLCVNSVYSAANAEVILDLHRFVVEKLRVNHAVSLVRGLPRDLKIRDMSLENYKAVVEAIGRESADSRYSFAKARQVVDEATKALVLKAAEEGSYALPCTAGRKTVVLSESGELYPCELLERSFGNVRDNGYDVPALLDSATGRGLKDEIVSRNCFCSWECIQPNNLLFNTAGRIFLLKTAVARALKRRPPQF